MNWSQMWAQAKTRAEWQKAFGPLPWWYEPLRRAELFLRRKLRRYTA